MLSSQVKLGWELQCAESAELGEEKPLLPDGRALIGWWAEKLVRAPWSVRGKR